MALDAKAEENAGAGTRVHHVLVVNPGSTSVKLAVFENDRAVHEQEAVCPIPPMAERTEREAAIARLTALSIEHLRESGIEGVDAIAARGGFLPRNETRIEGGVYTVAERREGHVEIGEAILRAVQEEPEMDHACNYGIPVAARLALELDVPAYIVDPVVVDEFTPEASVSGYAGILRRSTAHALSVRACARRAAKDMGRPLEAISLVVAHMGGGITVAAVRRGKIVDNNIALLGGGPFTPQRAGQLPTGEVLRLCYSGRFTEDELKRELTKRGGLRSYLGEDRMEVIEEHIAAGDERAQSIVDAMIYQIAKEIGAMAVAAGSPVDAIVFTGGLSRSPYIRRGLRRRVESLAPVLVYQGSLEMEALAEGALRVLDGRETPRHFRNA